MPEAPNQYFIINKPYKMVSQFISPDNVRLLGALNYDFPQGIHAIGRLDNDSEGLLILTTNKKVTRLLFQGAIPHERTYLVLVKGIVSQTELEQLRNGIPIFIKGATHYITEPCAVNIVEKPENLFPTTKEIHDFLPTTWLSITLKEGKFRQVRKMVLASGHRCIRLIRTSIENLTLGNLQPGEVKEIPERTFFELLKITDWEE
ncbi:MAG TPA: pseudouridine synthase [Edaphocola sp.]|nr:pseudouridine synthase [Edaphocola sp.]